MRSGWHTEWDAYMATLPARAELARRAEAMRKLAAVTEAYSAVFRRIMDGPLRDAARQMERFAEAWTLRPPA